ncbi:MAG: LUD domain-containing protein [bacterium]|nr:LUD domain-containing protein [bacterium]
MTDGGGGTPRGEFLARLGSGAPRGADTGEPPPTPAARFTTSRSGPDGFMESWTALGGTAERIPGEELPEAVAAYAARHDGPLLAAAGLGVGADLLWPDCGSQAAAGAAVGVVRAVAAAAQTGTVLLRAGDNGGRAASLLPPACIFVIEAGTVVDTLGDYLRSVEDPPSQLVAVTGPSRSADIESTLVIGVHGPGEVHAILTG